MGRHPVFDTAHFRQFTNDNPAVTQRLMKLFFQSVHNSLNQLHQARAQKNSKDWQVNIHQLKGAAGNLGAMQLYVLCKSIEDRQLQHTDKQQEALSEINGHLLTLKAELSRSLNIDVALMVTEEPREPI